jgi:GNAT superfamily N-acetyltransferase
VNRQIHEPFAISRATGENSAGILECLGLAFAPYRESYTREAFVDTVLTPEALRCRLTEMSVFVATGASGQIVGTIAAKVLNGDEGHLRGMAVRPEWQGSGVSERLLETAEKELRKAGCKTLTLDTTEPLKRAVRFYRKHGFQPTGRMVDFFGMPLFEYSKRL